MSSENKQKITKVIQLPGAKAFSDFLNERFPGRVDLGVIDELVDYLDKRPHSRVEVIIDGQKVGYFSWLDDKTWAISWRRKYIGRIPGYANDENILLMAVTDHQAFTPSQMNDFNRGIPFD